MEKLGVVELVALMLLLSVQEKTVEAQAVSIIAVAAVVHGLQEQVEVRSRTAVQECKSHILVRIIFLAAVAVVLTVLELAETVESEAAEAEH